MHLYPFSVQNCSPAQYRWGTNLLPPWSRWLCYSTKLRPCLATRWTSTHLASRRRPCCRGCVHLRAVQDGEGGTFTFYLADMALAGGKSGDVYIAGYVYGGEHAGCLYLRLSVLCRRITAFKTGTIFPYHFVLPCVSTYLWTWNTFRCGCGAHALGSLLGPNPSNVLYTANHSRGFHFWWCTSDRETFPWLIGGVILCPLTVVWCPGAADLRPARIPHLATPGIVRGLFE